MRGGGEEQGVQGRAFENLDSMQRKASCHLS